MLNALYAMAIWPSATKGRDRIPVGRALGVLPGFEAALDCRVRARIIDRHEGRRLLDVRIVLEMIRMRPKTRTGRSATAPRPIFPETSRLPSWSRVGEVPTTIGQGDGEEIIVELSLAYRIPSFACNKEGILKGALAGNVGDFYRIGKMSGEKAAHILKGSLPTWLRTESPRDDYIVVNADTARKLGITIPDDIMRKAQEVVANGTP